MSNEKFTPGEWTAHIGIMEPTYIFIGKEEDYVDGETPVICELHHGIKKKHQNSFGLDFDHSEMIANAYLISVAPKMYRVLDKCRSCIKHFLDGRWDDAVEGETENLLLEIDEVMKSGGEE